MGVSQGCPYFPPDCAKAIVMVKFIPMARTLNRRAYLRLTTRVSMMADLTGDEYNKCFILTEFCKLVVTLQIELQNTTVVLLCKLVVNTQLWPSEHAHIFKKLYSTEGKMPKGYSKDLR